MQIKLKYIIFTLFVFALYFKSQKAHCQSERRVYFYRYYVDIPDSLYSISCNHFEQHKRDTILCIFVKNYGFVSFDFMNVSNIGTSARILRYAIKKKQYISICGSRFLFVSDRLYTEETGLVFTYTRSDFSLRRFFVGRFEVLK